MRYVLGLVFLLLVTSGLCAADKTKSKTSSDQPVPLQLGILIGGKSWDLADTYPDKSRKNSQKAELHTPRNEAIIGFSLTDQNEYGLQYTCTYKDTLIGNEKTETVERRETLPQCSAQYAVAVHQSPEGRIRRQGRGRRRQHQNFMPAL